MKIKRYKILINDVRENENVIKGGVLWLIYLNIMQNITINL